MIEPGPLIRQALRFQPVKIAHRPLETDGRRVNGADRRKPSVGACEREDPDIERLLVEQRHVDGAAVAPKSKEAQAAFGQMRACHLPAVAADDRMPPGTTRFDPQTFEESVNERYCHRGFLID
jgi:hypothetical protein